MSGLVLDDVTVRRGAGPVISGVTASIEPGTVTALVGPNGAGKTSLLEALSGVLPIAGGRATLDGASLAPLSRRARFERGLVHVEQGRAVFPSLTVDENIRLTARSAAGVEAALEAFPELQKRRSSTAGLLSGGEQQMVVLARSLAANPKAVLLDEMSLGLAPVVFTRLLPLVTRLAASGVAVLLVEQFTHLALGIADRAVVVASGQVTWSGDASALAADEALLRRAYLGEGTEIRSTAV